MRLKPFRTEFFHAFATRKSCIKEKNTNTNSPCNQRIVYRGERYKTIPLATGKPHTKAHNTKPILLTTGKNRIPGLKNSPNQFPSILDGRNCYDSPRRHLGHFQAVQIGPLLQRNRNAISDVRYSAEVNLRQHHITLVPRRRCHFPPRVNDRAVPPCLVFRLRISCRRSGYHVALRKERSRERKKARGDSVAHTSRYIRTIRFRGASVTPSGTLIVRHRLKLSRLSSVDSNGQISGTRVHQRVRRKEICVCPHTRHSR